MRRPIRRLALVFALAAPDVLGAQHIIGQVDARAADSVFAAFDRTSSPGCALGVYQNGRPGLRVKERTSTGPSTDASVLQELAVTGRDAIRPLRQR